VAALSAQRDPHTVAALSAQRDPLTVAALPASPHHDSLTDDALGGLDACHTRFSTRTSIVPLRWPFTPGGSDVAVAKVSGVAMGASVEV
jgi:hypothetical protein